MLLAIETHCTWWLQSVARNPRHFHRKATQQSAWLLFYLCIQSPSREDRSLRWTDSRHQSRRAISTRIRRESEAESPGEDIDTRGRGGGGVCESVEGQSEKSQHIAARSRERETALFSSYSLRFPLKRFLFALVKYGSLAALYLSYPFTQTPFQLLRLEIAPIYERERQFPLPIAFNRFLCAHVSLPSFTG